MTDLHPLEVVARGSETQLQVGENLNYLIQRFKAKLTLVQLLVIAGFITYACQTWYFWL